MSFYRYYSYCIKKGAHLADICVKALISDSITLDILREKISGVVGDGAFIKGNKQFKNKMKELLHENLQFRWDILHLANRAHAAARGKAHFDCEDGEDEEYEDEEEEEVNEEERNETSGKKTETQEPENSMQPKSTLLETSKLPVQF